MSQVAEALAQKIIKTFTLKDLVKHKHTPYKNLYELCSIYPNQGIDFKVWRNTWPQNSYYIIKDTKFKDPSHGKAYGILFWEGKQQNQVPVYIRGGNKRGTWNYEINNSYAILDNGIEYKNEELQLYRNYNKKQNGDNVESQE